jgi:hypothetical protein
MMDRRTFVAGTLALLAVPLHAEAQPAAKIPRIGFLGPGPIADWSDDREAFRQGLRALGYIEGQNISIEWAVALPPPRHRARIHPGTWRPPDRTHPFAL